MSKGMGSIWKAAMVAGLLAAWAGATEATNPATATASAATKDSTAARASAKQLKAKAERDKVFEARRASDGLQAKERVERLKKQGKAEAKAREEMRKAPVEARVFISNEKSPSESAK